MYNTYTIHSYNRFTGTKEVKLLLKNYPKYSTPVVTGRNPEKSQHTATKCFEVGMTTKSSAWIALRTDYIMKYLYCNSYL